MNKDFFVSKENILKELDVLEKKLGQKPEGITIDHKTFSDLVNVLATGVSAGTVEDEFFNKILDLGKGQVNYIPKEQPVEPKQEEKEKLSAETMKSEMDAIIKEAGRAFGPLGEIIAKMVIVEELENLKQEKQENKVNRLNFNKCSICGKENCPKRKY